MSHDSLVPETLLIVNPKSGRGDHLAPVAQEAADAGYAIRFTEGRGHATELAAAAVHHGVEEVVAVGGDGTLHEVVKGVYEAEGLDDVTVAVIPAGTGNDFATNIGIPSIADGFEILADGERRALDLGIADGRPFVNSCIAGITAEASAQTSPEMKSRLGVLAYVVTTIRSLSEFGGIHFSAEVHDGAGDTETVWEGSAAMVLVGNGRRFTMTGGEQADLQDGLLDVTIIEEASTIELIGEGTRNLFGDAADHLTRFLADSLELSVESAESATFSLDGEMESREAIALTNEPGALRMPVGAGYDPHPDDPA